MTPSDRPEPFDPTLASAPEPAPLEPALGEWLSASHAAREGPPAARRAACTLLGRLGDERGRPILMSALGDPEWAVRKAAVYALGRLGGEAALEPLLGAVADAHPRVRQAALRALAPLDDGRRLSVWLGALSDADWRVRAVALEGLRAYEGPWLLGRLLGLLKDSAWLVRYRAAAALAELADERAVPALEAALAADAELAPWCALALTRHGQPGLAALLRQFERAPSGRARAVADALGALDDERARDALTSLVGHPDREVEAAVLAQGGSMRPRLEALLGEPDWRRRWHACRLLGRLGAGGSAVPMLPLLHDARIEVRLEALEALRRWPGAEGEPDLLRCLQDPGWHVREAACEALAALATPGALLALERARRDSRDEVREAARRGLAVARARQVAKPGASVMMSTPEPA